MRKLIIIAILFFTIPIYSLVKDGNDNLPSPQGNKYFYKDTLSKEDALKYITENYPKAQLSDLYKSFYQDAFGPGHILEDTMKSRKYFEYELSDTSEWTESPLFEPAGEGKNFYRVNMDVIRKNIIPEDVYFNAFVSGLEKTAAPSAEEWIDEWKDIDSLLKINGYNFPEETKDREMIQDKIRRKDFVMHHSVAFDSIYNFHYRIISVPVFNEILLPYLLK